MSDYTAEEQALIDGVELAIDYCLAIDEEDLKKYKILMDKSAEY